MITVIIPAMNESDTIDKVVRFALSSPDVTEVLVIDDKSLDNTVNQARLAGAAVITSTKLGKGASMKDGLLCASNEILVYLDGDIHPYPDDTIRLLAAPLIRNEADFVKSCFSRNAGRVTELVARPLLTILFPDLGGFKQPLSGMIAGRKSMLQQIDFRDDYGVDIGILIDMHLMKARIREVNIGHIENKSRPWQALGKMSKEVSQAIIQRAFQQNKPNANLEELQSLTEIRDQMDFAIKESLLGLDKMIVFDMDNTLLEGKFIDTCSQLYGFERELLNIRSMENDPVILTKSIAGLMKGLNISQILAVADRIPLVEHTAVIIAHLKSKGYITGIITDSYDVVANHIKTKIGADFSLGNELEFSKSVATGEVKIPSFFFNRTGSLCRHNMCKTNAATYILNKYKIQLNNMVAVGDGVNDLCLIRNAGIGISFCSSNDLMNVVADIKISERSFETLQDLL